MLKKLVILGTSGNALDILDIVEAINAQVETWQFSGVLDDGRPLGQMFHGISVLGGLAKAAELKDCWFINAIGSDATYRRRPEFVAASGVEVSRFATLVHPLASVSARARLGRGVYVNFGASIAGNVTIEDHVSIGPRVIVGHDSSIGAYSVIAPGAVISGAVQIGNACYIGAAANLRQRVSVEDGALVGMAAVVLNDVKAGTTVVGNPARVLIRNLPKPKLMSVLA